MSNDTCNISVLAMVIAEKLELSIYHVLTPIYLIVGISTDIILLFAFYKQSKTEKAYGYQVIFTISKMLEIFAFGTYLLAEKWFQFDNISWFVANYCLMYFYVTDLGLHVSFIISSLLLSLAMAADRVFALQKPIIYKNIHHFRHQLIATIFCFY